MLVASFCSYVGIAILEEKGSQDWLVLQVTNINNVSMAALYHWSYKNNWLQFVLNFVLDFACIGN